MRITIITKAQYVYIYITCDSSIEMTIPLYILYLPIYYIYDMSFYVYMFNNRSITNKGAGHVIFNFQLGVGQSGLCQNEGVGHVFFFFFFFFFFYPMGVCAV